MERHAQGNGVMTIYLSIDQAQMVAFVLIDADCDEVAGLGAAFNPFVSKAGAAFAAGVGAGGEIGNGWYHYTLTPAETDTVGPVSMYITGAGAEQQNLLFFVRSACVGCTDRTYIVYSTVAPNPPILGVSIKITTDIAGNNIVWCGVTDAAGVARDANGDLPCLLPGTYYFWRNAPGYIFSDPDTEVYV